jgi:dihydrofolate reductase
MANISVLAATESGIIGIRNEATGETRMPWSMIPVDNAWFRGLLVGRIIVVGNRTYKELSGYIHNWDAYSIWVYTSRTSGRGHPGVEYFDAGEALDWVGDAVVIGGAHTTKALLAHTDLASLTLVPATALLPLAEGESYVVDKQLVDDMRSQFDLRRVMPYTKDSCRILFGKRK